MLTSDISACNVKDIFSWASVCLAIRQLMPWSVRRMHGWINIHLQTSLGKNDNVHQNKYENLFANIQYFMNISPQISRCLNLLAFLGDSIEFDKLSLSLK